MRKFIVLALALAAVVLAGCGSSASVTKAEHNKDTQAGVSFAETVGRKCVPNVLTLRNHQGRVQAKTCIVLSVPPKKREAFGACVTRAVETSGLSRKRFEAKLDSCYQTAVKA